MRQTFIIFIILFILQICLVSAYSASSASVPVSITSQKVGLFTVTPTATTKNTALNTTPTNLIPATTKSNYLQVETVIWLKIIFGGIMFQSGLITALIMAVKFKL